MQSISFNPNGGPITVRLSAGQAQTGSYEFRLWEAGTNRLVTQQQGNFLTDADDSYQLPTPNADNNGRRIQGVIVIGLLPPITKYSAAMTVEQDAKTLGEIPISGTSNQPSVILNLYATLTAETVQVQEIIPGTTVAENTPEGTDGGTARATQGAAENETEHATTSTSGETA